MKYHCHVPYCTRPAGYIITNRTKGLDEQLETQVYCLPHARATFRADVRIFGHNVKLYKVKLISYKE